MTIAVAVRTASAVVFAADSKITTRGLAGISPEDGSLQWIDQTYDNATKVAHDQSHQLMAMVAGHANIGITQALDFIAMRAMAPAQTAEDQEAQINALLEEMVAAKRAFWSEAGVEPPEWPGPTLLLASYCPEHNAPKLWHVDLSGEGFECKPVLAYTGIYLEGSYRDVFGLIYGWRPDFITGLGAELHVDDDALRDAIRGAKVLQPVDQINCATMPLQDAIDLAVFLCTVQVEMDRFLPGLPACGGPIDVMVYRTVPAPEIIGYPGKELHHPHNRG